MDVMLSPARVADGGKILFPQHSLTVPNIIARFGRDGAGLVRRHWIIVGKDFGGWQGGNVVSRINPL